MNPDIERYLDEHGSLYTRQALRQALLDAGHEPAQIDAAFEEWSARSGASQAPGAEQRQRLWVFTVGVHVAVLLTIGALSVAIGSFNVDGRLALGILAVVLLGGVWVSGLVGRRVLRRSTLAAAVVVPVISALVIGGSCLALGGSFILRSPPPPPTSGTLELRIEPPDPFVGSGPATCQAYRDGLGFSVLTDGVGTFRGGRVLVSIDASGLTPAAPAASAATWDQYGLSISIVPPGEDVIPIDYAQPPESLIQLRASQDGRAGTVEFRGLQPARGGETGGVAGLQPISGTITWKCG